ncbi:MAG: N-acetyltransferase [Acidobacteriota bacterium]
MQNLPLSEPVIRDCSPADLARLYEIDRLCFPPGIAYTREELQFYLSHPGSIARAAQLGPEILGFVIGRIEGEMWGHVITLDVLPEARRRGIGSRLLENLHGEFRAAGTPLAVLEVDTENTAARAFYQGFGYTRVETIPGYYAGGRDAHRMVLFL